MKKASRKTIRLMGNSLRKSVPRVLRVQGSTLLYIVLVMVIFGMLGATVVSLFTTSTVSSATVNEDRRARYLYESAVRYATSEMRNNDFDQDMIDDLDATTYTLDDVGTFDYDIYSMWFRSAVSVDLPLGDPLLRVKLDEGEIPDAIAATIPSGGLYVVNIESTTPDASGNLHIPAYDPNTNTILPNSHAIVNGFFKDSPTSYRVAITDASDNTFSVGTDERICFAVRPTASQSPGTGGELYVHEDARFILPKFNGVVWIKTETVLYEEAVHDPGNVRVRLTGLSDGVSVDASDYVILWPANHTVIPTANTANVIHGGSANYAVNVVDTGDLTLGKYGTARPDIDDKEFVENLNEKESGPTNFFERDLVDKKLSIGDSSGLSSDAFGGAWYDADKSAGGRTNYCSTGRCEFGIGIRVFFTFTYSGTGDGFIFSIINGVDNDVDSIGGDIQASELLGYAGDSRITANPGAPPSANYLDTTGEGLQPPKIALEFDTRTNFNAAIESSLAYCSDATNLNVNTRNDPLSSGKDAVQYVFWGRDSFIDIPCRDPSPGRDTYDDNRHNALGFASGDWSVNLFSDVRSSPTVGPDGTIYVGSDNDRLYAVEPGTGSGSIQWSYPTSGEVRTQPALSNDGSTVFATSTNGNLYAISTSSGNLQWSLPLGAASPSKPVVDSNGLIYVTAGINLIKIDPAGPTILLLFSAPLNPTARSAPVLNGDGSRVLVIFNNDQLYALNSADFTAIWNRPASGSIGSPAVHPSTGDIYVSVNTGMNQWGSDGTFKGSYGFGSSVSSGPSISLDGNTVYVGYATGVLAARDASGLGPRWTYSTGSSQAITSPPMIDASEHIYFGSDNNSVYALFSDGSLKWSFATGGDVRTTPAIDANGIVYAGSDDNQLWAIEALAEPQNYRQNLDGVPASSELARNLVAYNAAGALDPYPAGFMPTDSDDWLKSGPWAVRMEIIRNPSSGDYMLRTWVRQCTSGGCNGLNNPLGTFFEDTRITYEPLGKDPSLEQSFNLGGSLNTDFNRYLFGFTSAGTAGDDQSITIGNFQLSFIRPNDPVITNDPQFP